MRSNLSSKHLSPRQCNKGSRNKRISLNLNNKLMLRNRRGRKQHPSQPQWRQQWMILMMIFPFSSGNN
jgi:DNA-binding transcriptional regulator PaaX